MAQFCIDHIPDASFYLAGLIEMGDRVTAFRRNLLLAHYYSPQRSCTAPQLASLAGVSHYSTVNAQYGGLGRAFCETTKFEPQIRPEGTPRWWGVWSRGYDHPDGFVWIMHDNVAESLEQLGWVDADTTRLTAEELPHNVVYSEGARIQVACNAYERNRAARAACIEHYGYDCVCCGFNFSAVYGGFDLIHVHHLKQLSDIGESYEVDPINDLRPVCPNCHAIIHRTNDALEISEVKRLLNGKNAG